MTKIQKIALFLILLLILILFSFSMQETNKKPIQIKPIQIKTLATSKKCSPPKVVKEKPIDILSKLKIATKASTEGIIPSKEEMSNRVLESLKTTIDKQKRKETMLIKPIIKKVVAEYKKYVILRSTNLRLRIILITI